MTTEASPDFAVKPMLTGEQVLLRPFRDDDLPAIRAALADPEVVRLTGSPDDPVDEERLYRVVDALAAIAADTGKSIPQVALNWLLQRPTVSTVLIGARDEAQLRDNLGAVGWSLDAHQMQRLDEASRVTPPYPYYPYWNGMFAERNPPPV